MYVLYTQNIWKVALGDTKRGDFLSMTVTNCHETGLDKYIHEEHILVLKVMLFNCF